MSANPIGLNAAAAAPSAPGVPGAGARLERAYLQVFEPPADNAPSEPGARLEPINFQFNPKEMTISKSATWSRNAAQGNASSSRPTFTGAQPSTMTFEMFIDASDKHDTSVVRTVEKLLACCVPTAATLQQHNGKPPCVMFRWGGLTGFLAYVKSVSARYTLFTAGGVPIRAVCSITLEELSGDPPRQNPTSGTPVPHRVHRVVEGDTLPMIAFGEYGDASLWRSVAEVNRIDDPQRLRIGGSILLPSADDLPPRLPGSSKELAHESA